MNRYTALEKKAIDFGTGQKLYPSEIHTIEVIGNDEGMISRDLALGMGVTKGAVSQTITKLCSKGFVRKERGGENGREVLLHLTETGRKAWAGHEEFHRSMFSDFIKVFEEIPPDQIDMLEGILERVDSTLEGYQKKI